MKIFTLLLLFETLIGTKDKKLEKNSRSRVSMAAFKSSSGRLFDSPQQTTYIPGPGHYDIDVKQNQSNLPRSAFASKSERSTLRTTSDFPGPGAYNLVKYHDSTLKLTKLPPTKSSSSIITLKTVNKDHENYPGPGTYNITTELIPKHFMSSSVFLSNVPRWTMPNVPLALGIGDMVANSSSLTCPGGIDALLNPGPTKYNPCLPQKMSFHYNLNNEWMY